MERGILFTMLMHIVYYLALLTLNSKGFDIERKVTADDMMPHPAADAFESPRRLLCSLFDRDCRRRGAKCSRRSCCKCECRGHLPNFLSLDKGCMSVNDIMRFPGKNEQLHSLRAGSTDFVKSSEAGTGGRTPGLFRESVVYARRLICIVTWVRNVGVAL